MDVWGGTCGAEKTATAKALGQENADCFRNNEEATGAGAEGSGEDVGGMGTDSATERAEVSEDQALILTARC